MYFNQLFNYCPVCGSNNFVQNNIKSKRCDTCGFTLYVNPSAATAAFIRNEKGELLVCKRAKEPEKDKLDLPGGFVDEHETAEEGMIREIKEETGLDVIKVRYLFSVTNEYLYSGFTIPTLDLFFEATIDNFAQIKANDDVAACSFVPLSEINIAEFGLSSIRKGVEKYINQKTDNTAE